MKKKNANATPAPTTPRATVGKKKNAPAAPAPAVETSAATPAAPESPASEPAPAATPAPIALDSKGRPIARAVLAPLPADRRGSDGTKRGTNDRRTIVPSLDRREDLGAALVSALAAGATVGEVSAIFGRYGVPVSPSAVAGRFRTYFDIRKVPGGSKSYRTTPAGTSEAVYVATDAPSILARIGKLA